MSSLVGTDGIEPSTSSLSARRSAGELRAQVLYYYTENFLRLQEISLSLNSIVWPF